MEREIRIHIVQNHEYIIKLYAAFEDEKHVYMVQEYASCGDLFEDLKKGGGQVKEKAAVRDIIAPFLSALLHLHAQVGGWGMHAAPACTGRAARMRLLRLLAREQAANLCRRRCGWRRA